MKNYIIGIYDEEFEYMERLCELINSDEVNAFEINCFKDRESIYKAIKQGNIQMAMIGASVYIGTKDELIDKALIVIDDGNYDGDLETIWKYQSAVEIKKDILRILASKDGEESVYEIRGRKRTKLIGVYSPFSQELKSVCAFLIGKELSGKNLYIDLNSFRGCGFIEDELRGDELTDLLYVMKGKEDRFYLKLGSMVTSQGGLDVLPPVKMYTDLQSVAKEDWGTFISLLKKQGMYEHIILDLSESVKGLIEVLRECDEVYSINPIYNYERCRWQQYIDVLKILDYEDVINKTKQLEISQSERILKNVPALEQTELRKCIRNEL